MSQLSLINTQPELFDEDNKPQTYFVLDDYAYGLFLRRNNNAKYITELENDTPYVSAWSSAYFPFFQAVLLTVGNPSYILEKTILEDDIRYGVVHSSSVNRSEVFKQCELYNQKIEEEKIKEDKIKCHKDYVPRMDTWILRSSKPVPGNRLSTINKIIKQFDKTITRDCVDFEYDGLFQHIAFSKADLNINEKMYSNRYPIVNTLLDIKQSDDTREKKKDHDKNTFNFCFKSQDDCENLQLNTESINPEFKDMIQLYNRLNTETLKKIEVELKVSVLFDGLESSYIEAEKNKTMKNLLAQNLEPAPKQDTSLICPKDPIETAKKVREDIAFLNKILLVPMKISDETLKKCNDESVTVSIGENDKNELQETCAQNLNHNEKNPNKISQGFPIEKDYFLVFVADNKFFERTKGIHQDILEQWFKEKEIPYVIAPWSYNHKLNKKNVLIMVYLFVKPKIFHTSWNNMLPLYDVGEIFEKYNLYLWTINRTDQSEDEVKKELWDKDTVKPNFANNKLSKLNKKDDCGGNCNYVSELDFIPYLHRMSLGTYFYNLDYYLTHQNIFKKIFNALNEKKQFARDQTFLTQMNIEKNIRLMYPVFIKEECPNGYQLKLTNDEGIFESCASDGFPIHRHYSLEIIIIVEDNESRNFSGIDKTKLDSKRARMFNNIPYFENITFEMKIGKGEKPSKVYVRPWVIPYLQAKAPESEFIQKYC